MGEEGIKIRESIETLFKGFNNSIYIDNLKTEGVKCPFYSQNDEKCSLDTKNCLSGLMKLTEKRLYCLRDSQTLSCKLEQDCRCGS